MEDEKEVLISVRVPLDIAQKIDKHRKSFKLPRSTWVFQAILDRIEKIYEIGKGEKNDK